MDPAYGIRYAELYRRHWWWRAREEFLLRVLDRAVGPGGAGSVLDFGCGDGLFLDALRRYGEPWGIEPDATLLDPHGPWRDRISTGPLEDVRTEHGRHGLLVALDVLEHIEDPGPVMAILAKRLRPGGTFVATVPAFMAMWTTHDDVNHHHHRYRLPELRRLMRQAGLDVIESRYFFSWLALPKLGVALMERIVRPTPRPAGIPPAPVNAMALTVSRIEQRLLSALPLPFGSSALVVARAPLNRGAPPSP